MNRKPSFTTMPHFTELAIETGKLYIVRYYPDGKTEYLVNLAPVPELPNTPATKVLLEVASKTVDKIMRLFTLPDGREKFDLYYEIDQIVEG